MTLVSGIPNFDTRFNRINKIIEQSYKMSKSKGSEFHNMEAQGTAVKKRQPDFIGYDQDDDTISNSELSQNELSSEVQNVGAGNDDEDGDNSESGLF